MNFPIERFYIAYRKAKNEAFRDTNCAHGLKFAIYERDLAGNLARLRQKLIRSDAWRRDLSFIGQITCIPKEVTPPPPEGDSAFVHCQVSEPISQWKRECSTQKAKADFRPVIDPTVEFMVVSALWIIEVGDKFDSKLNTLHAVGNRLRRWRASEDSEPGTAGEINLLTPNLFNPYFSAYGKWRADGLAAMRKELREGHDVVAVTMDLRRFYHNIDPSFLLQRSYLSQLGLTLRRTDHEFTSLFLEALATWNHACHLRYGCPDTGLPVGLTASGLIANVILAEFDRRVVAQLDPVHYGRYVDDVFLVLRRPAEFDTGQRFLFWLAEQLKPIATVEITADPERPDPSLRINFPYAGSSELVFSGKKQKIFQLSGEHGLDLINPIEEQIKRNTSEFRDLPKLPATEGEMAHRALLVTPDAHLEADALRKADTVTLRRSGFAMLLGDVEAHAHDLNPKAWAGLRRQFYGLAKRHLLTPRAFFDYARYLPRVVALMAGCGDWRDAERLVGGIANVRVCLRDTCEAVTGLLATQLADTLETIGARCIEAVLQSVPVPNGQTLQLIKKIRRITGAPAGQLSTVAGLRATAAEIRLLDWAREPYSSQWLAASADAAEVAVPRSRAIKNVLPLAAARQFQSEANLFSPHWLALAFPTRPIPVDRITASAPSLLLDGSRFSQIVQALRGTWMPPSTQLRVIDKMPSTPPHILIPGQLPPRPTVAITSLEVSNKEWLCAAKGKPDLSLKRYQRLNKLLDECIAYDPRPTYILLPELAIPRRWATRILNKLNGRGVSMIGGLEYGNDPRNPSVLTNEAIIAVRTNYPGYFRSLVLLQSKWRPAWREAKDLAKLHRTVRHAAPGPFDRPVYLHGSFAFATLICSDLTDIQNRQRFQGNVDCLFVPEWNQDVTSFASLVESAALDVHAYVAQANNRRFGDSRLRGPMRESYLRDLVQLKGGKNDYFVIGEINHAALRRYQSRSTPPEGKKELFKPFPIGFPERLSAFRQFIPPPR